MALGVIEGLALAKGIGGLFKRRRPNPYLERLAASSAAAADNQDAEASAAAFGVEGAERDYQAEVARRIAELSKLSDPAAQAARFNTMVAPGRSAYESAISRLRSAGLDRGTNGSSIQAGALARLEAARAGSEATAGARLAMGREQEQEAASGRILALRSSGLNAMRSRLAAAQARALQLRQSAAGAGERLDQYERQEQNQEASDFGGLAEVLAGIYQDVDQRKRRRPAPAGGAPAADPWRGFGTSLAG